MPETVTFIVPGPPKGKGRPRFVKATGRTYTPADTVSAEMRVREAWRVAGSPGPALGPVNLIVHVQVARPANHFRVNGDLSAAGRRAPMPVRKPDLDNVLKLVGDALNGCMWKDDAQIVQAQITRAWGQVDQVEIRVAEWRRWDGQEAA